LLISVHAGNVGLAVSLLVVIIAIVNCTNTGIRCIEADSDADETVDGTRDMLLSELMADDDIYVEHEEELC
jgi:hypothetical protein